MDRARWNRVQQLFHEVADRPAPEQRHLLEAACGGDDSLIADVIALLEADGRTVPLLDADVTEVAHRLMNADGATSDFPERFGSYRILKRLASGGMGDVFLATREDLGNQVAIKFLRDAWMSPARLRRFVVEQRTLAQLHHPSIARLYDANVLEDGTPWFAMEYVDGVSLTEYCRQNKCSLEKRLLLFRSLCEAVRYSHQNLVIHSDLKPSNVLVKADGSVRLLDFGISKHIESLDSADERTRAGLRLMTPAYAAPEQLRGDSVGFSTDIYSLGVILYELLTECLPFDLADCTPGEAERMIMDGQPRRPSLIVREAKSARGQTEAPLASKSAWADLDVLCLGSMHRDVQRRYGSVEALIRDVDHYLKDEPLEGRPDSFGYRSAKFLRRNWRPLGIAATVIILIAAGLVVFTVRLDAARDEALAASARTQQVQRFMINLFEGGDKQAGPAEGLRVVTLLARGEQQTRALSSNPQLQADLYQALGAIYEQLGDIPKADSLLVSALDKRNSLHDPNHPQVIDSLLALGSLRVNQSRFEEAEKLIDDALGRSKHARERNRELFANATTALGSLYEAKGDYKRAETVLAEAVRLHSQIGSMTPELSSAMSELANTHFYAGHYDESESLNLRVLGINRKLFGDHHPFVASDLINLSAIAFQREQYSRAEQLCRQALEIYRGWYGDDHFETGASLMMLGQALVFQKRYDEARAILTRALEIRERVYGPAHPRVASAANELGTLALKTGKLDDAEASFRRMVEIYKKAYDDHHYLISIALSNLASVYMERRQYARAEQLFAEAVHRYATTLPAEHLNVAIARTKLGRAIARQGRYREAEGESLAAYRALMKQSAPPVTRLQDVRRDLADIYEALGEKDKAQQFRNEPAPAVTSVAAK